MKRLFADLARISARRPPALRLPARVALAGAEAATWAGAGLASSVGEVRSASLWWTYRNAKAKRELGFKPRAHEETLEDSMRWQLDQLGDSKPRGGPEQLALRAISRAMRGAGRLVGG